MLLKAIAALKADKAKTLDLINKGEGGFLDRDLYVFCDNLSDGKTVAIGNPNSKQTPPRAERAPGAGVCTFPVCPGLSGPAACGLTMCALPPLAKAAPRSD
jgi:hypothetical protein